MSHRLRPDALILIASSSYFQLFSALHFPFSLGLFLEWALGPRGEHSLPLFQFLRPAMHKRHWVAPAPGVAVGWIQKIRNWVLERSKYLPDLLDFSYRKSATCFRLPSWRETFPLYDKVTEVPSRSGVFWILEVQMRNVWLYFKMWYFISKSHQHCYFVCFLGFADFSWTLPKLPLLINLYR